MVTLNLDVRERALGGRSARNTPLLGGDPSRSTASTNWLIYDNVEEPRFGRAPCSAVSPGRRLMLLPDAGGRAGFAGRLLGRLGTGAVGQRRDTLESNSVVRESNHDRGRTNNRTRGIEWPKCVATHSHADRRTNWRPSDRRTTKAKSTGPADDPKVQNRSPELLSIRSLRRRISHDLELRIFGVTELMGLHLKRPHNGKL